MISVGIIDYYMKMQPLGSAACAYTTVTMNNIMNNIRTEVTKAYNKAY